eukprot:g6103.t1
MRWTYLFYSAFVLLGASPPAEAALRSGVGATDNVEGLHVHHSNQRKFLRPASDDVSLQEEQQEQENVPVEQVFGDNVLHAHPERENRHNQPKAQPTVKTSLLLKQGAGAGAADGINVGGSGAGRSGFNFTTEEPGLGRLRGSGEALLLPQAAQYETASTADEDQGLLRRHASRHRDGANAFSETRTSRAGVAEEVDLDTHVATARLHGNGFDNHDGLGYSEEGKNLPIPNPCKNANSSDPKKKERATLLRGDTFFVPKGSAAASQWNGQTAAARADPKKTTFCFGGGQNDQVGAHIFLERDTRQITLVWKSGGLDCSTWEEGGFGKCNLDKWGSRYEAISPWLIAGKADKYTG